ncbi:ABC transporter permease [Candidatus Solincola sp.]|nr:ABC transporter permease [Actinomycetota bacterium]
MRAFLKVVIYDLKMTLRQREAVFWLLLFPILLMAILGLVFGGSGEIRLSVGLVDIDGSPVSRAVVEAFEGIDALKVEVGEEGVEREALREGKRNAILIIPEGFGDRVSAGRTGEVVMLVNRSEMTTAQVTSSTLRGILEKVGQAMTGAPEVIAVREEEAGGTKDFEYIDFMIPGILAMVIMFSGLTGYSLEIATYREKGILRRIRVSPLPLSTFLAGGIVSVLLFSILQAVVLVAFGVLAFGMKLQGNYLGMALLVLLGSLSFLAVGFLIASLTRNSRSAGLAAQAIGLPMMFLSGIFFSLEWVPVPVRVIARCLPLYYLGDGLRGVMIDAAHLADIWVDVVVLVGVGVAAFLAAVRFFRWE